jgi:hypothetical protein
VTVTALSWPWVAACHGAEHVCKDACVCSVHEHAMIEVHCMQALRSCPTHGWLNALQWRTRELVTHLPQPPQSSLSHRLASCPARSSSRCADRGVTECHAHKVLEKKKLTDSSMHGACSKTMHETRKKKRRAPFITSLRGAHATFQPASS